MPPVAQDHIIGIGDSTIDYNGQISSHSSVLASYIWWPPTSAWLDQSGSGANSSWYPDLGKQWNSNLGRTLGVINGAESGTRLLDSWNPALEGNRLPGVKTMWQNSGSPAITAVICQLGVNDIYQGSISTSNAYRDVIQAIQSYCSTNFSAPLYFSMLADTDPNHASFGGSLVTYTTHMNTIRQGILDAVSLGYALQGPVHMGQEYTDRTHPDSLALAAVHGRSWYLRLNGGLLPPKMSRITYEAATKTIRVTFDKELEAGLSSVGGFRAFDNGTSVTIMSQTKIGPRTVAVVLNSALAGIGTLSFGGGEDAMNVTLPDGITQALVDLSTYASPPVPFFIQPMTTYSTNIGWLRP